MICKYCGKTMGELEYFCDNCFTIVDFDEHEKNVDKSIKNGLIKTQNVKLKKNHIHCDKCGANVKIGWGFCENCRHIICEDVFIKQLKLGMLETKNEIEKIRIKKNTRVLRFACFCVPLLGLFLKFVYKKSNPILSDLCYDAWINGLGRIRLLIIVLVVLLIKEIF